MGDSHADGDGRTDMGLFFLILRGHYADRALDLEGLGEEDGWQSFCFIGG